MDTQKREIYVKLEEISKIVELMNTVKQQEAQLKALFEKYDELVGYEGKAISSWGEELEKITQRVDKVTM